jgi:hypothetical protein
MVDLFFMHEAGTKSIKKLFSQRMCQSNKDGFPLQVHDSAGRAVCLLGFACGVSPVPLIPQEIVRLPLQSAYVQKEAVNNLK